MIVVDTNIISYFYLPTEKTVDVEDKKFWKIFQQLLLIWLMQLSNYFVNY